MSYNIALQFEDGVRGSFPAKGTNWSPTRPFAPRSISRSIAATALAAPASAIARAAIIELSDYIEDAMTEDEAAQGFVLTCRMRPKSDCVLKVPPLRRPARSKRRRMRACCRASIAARRRQSTFSLSIDRALAFLPGQYVNLQVPGRQGDARPIPSVRRPNQTTLSFLVRDMPRRPDERLHARQGRHRRPHGVRRTLSAASICASRSGRC